MSVWDKTLEHRYGDRLAPKSALAAGTSETPEQIAARVRTEEAKRVAEINAACDLAGCPERAADFIADRTKVLSDVLAILVRSKGRPKR
jgi:hypothetical protein